MKIVIVTLIIGLTCRNSVQADSLNDWVVSKIQADEQIWVKAIGRIDGHQLELLQSSKFYVPFFMEPPDADGSLTANDRELFENWKQQEDEVLLPGGYIFRIRFKTAEPLYAMSAGFWNEDAWHSVALGKDVTVEPGSLWESSNGDYLYATLLAGVRPRLLIYDQSGEIARQESFDASAADFEQRLQAVIAAYPSSTKPVLEMVSLAEYLEQPNALWRTVDVSGQFNLRNQHQRADERERLKVLGKLTRSAAISALIKETASNQDSALVRPERKSRPGSDSASPPIPETHSTSASTQVALIDQRRSMQSWFIIFMAVAMIGLLLLIFKKRKRPI